MATVQNLCVKVVVPAQGVTSTTGLVLMLPGIDSSMDCERPIFTHDPDWPNQKDVALGFVYYRNEGYSPPYDLGKLQITDVLRALGTVLREFPQVDTNRLYLFGGSGGGQVALQVLQCSEHLWAEVHAHCPITTVTVGLNLAAGYDQDPAPFGWNEELLFPVERRGITPAEWNRVQAERALRSPQAHLPAGITNQVEGADYPRVVVMHGDTDRTTDFQHFLDLKELVGNRLNGAFTRRQVFGAAEFTLGRWTFWQLFNASHSYGTAAPGLRSRAKATNTLVSEAFTARRGEAPVLRIASAFPSQYGWTFSVTGELETCRLEVRRADLPLPSEYSLY